jgi:TatD DNase family protein
MEIISEDLSLFETHFHSDSEIDDEDYYNHAVNAGVDYFVAASSNLDSSISSETFAEKFNNVWFSAGVHPHDAALDADNISEFAKFAKNRKCVAIGEIGVDYFYNNSEREVQLQVFDRFLKMALDFNLPAIIHCRDKADSEQAYIDTFLHLKKFAADGGRFVVHCYTGTIAWAEKFLDLGGYLGITGIVTFPKAQNVRDVLKVIPDDKLLLETDAPYLAPVPKRGKKNHSKYLPYIAAKIAEERSVSLKTIAETTTSNAKKLFVV